MVPGVPGWVEGDHQPLPANSSVTHPPAPPQEPAPFPPTAGTLTPGVEVGHFVLEARLGRGGMSEVWRAVDTRTQGRVALKLLRDAPHDDDARARMRREFSVLQRLSHERLAKVVDADTEGHRPYIATKYVPADALDVWVKRHGPMSGTDLVRFGSGLLEGVQAIHELGILHRDMKPGNVLVYHGDPVIIDFGISHLVADARMTQRGVVMGTMGYVPPELLQEHQDPDRVTDWWGLVATLAFASSGVAPFGADDARLIQNRVFAGKPSFPGADPRLIPLLVEGLRPSLEERATPEELIAGWLRYARGGSPADELRRPHAASPVSGGVPVVPVAPKPLSGVSPLAGAAAGALAGAVASSGAPLPPPIPGTQVAAPEYPVTTAPHPVQGTMPRTVAAPPAAAWGESAGGAAPPVAAVGVTPNPAASVATGGHHAPGPSGSTPPAAPGYPGGSEQGADVSATQQQPAARTAHLPASSTATPLPQPVAHVGGGATGEAPPAVVPQRSRLRTGTLLALGFVVVMCGAVAPWYTLVAAFAWSVAARTADRAMTSVALRRMERGTTDASRDVWWAILGSPWHAIGAVFSAVGAALLPLTVFCAGILAAKMSMFGPQFAALNGGTTTARVLMGAIAATVVVAWWGPAGGSLRRGSRHLVRALSPGLWGPRILAASLVVAGCVLFLYTNASHFVVSWSPWFNPLSTGARGLDPWSALWKLFLG